MAAIEATNVRELVGLVANTKDGSPANLTAVEITATTTATSNTLDLNTVIPCTGIVGPLSENVDEAVAATASTWSSTTVTFAGHTGSGRYRGVFLIEQ